MQYGRYLDYCKLSLVPWIKLNLGLLKKEHAYDRSLVVIPRTDGCIDRRMRQGIYEACAINVPSNTVLN